MTLTTIAEHLIYANYLEVEMSDEMSLPESRQLQLCMPRQFYAVL